MRTRDEIAVAKVGNVFSRRKFPRLECNIWARNLFDIGFGSELGHSHSNIEYRTAMAPKQSKTNISSGLKIDNCMTLAIVTATFKKSLPCKSRRRRRITTRFQHVFYVWHMRYLSRLLMGMFSIARPPIANTGRQCPIHTIRLEQNSTFRSITIDGWLLSFRWRNSQIRSWRRGQSCKRREKCIFSSVDTLQLPANFNPYRLVIWGIRCLRGLHSGKGGQYKLRGGDQ